jgi:hypothetical protein
MSKKYVYGAFIGANFRRRAGVSYHLRSKTDTEVEGFQ